MLEITVGDDEVKVREVISTQGDPLRTKAGHLALPLLWESVPPIKEQTSRTEFDVAWEITLGHED